MASRWAQNYELYRRYTRNLAMLYQKRQEVRAFVELLLSLSAITVFGVFAIRPTIVTVLDLNNQIAGKKETVALLDAKIAALSEAQEIYNNNLESLPLVDIAIPDNPSPESFIRQVEGLVNRHSLLILDINSKDIPVLGATQSEVPLAEEPQIAGQNFDIQLTAIGNYPGIFAFLKDFESLKRTPFEDIVNIRLTQGDLPGELTISITGKLAYFTK